MAAVAAALCDYNRSRAGLGGPFGVKSTSIRARAEARPAHDLRSAGVEDTDGELAERWGLVMESVRCWPATALNV